MNQTKAKVLWQPTKAQIESSAMHKFAKRLEEKYHCDLPDYQSLHKFSVKQKEEFWQMLWHDYVLFHNDSEQVLQDKTLMPGATWFKDARLNYAENLLHPKTYSHRNSDDVAIVFKAENQYETEITHSELYDKVSRGAQALRAMGVVKGDRVAAMMPNMPETIIYMLAATSLGAVWSSCSPDFGVKGVVDRFGQITPKVFIAVNGYFYNGKELDCVTKITEISEQIPSLEAVVVIAYTPNTKEAEALISQHQKLVWEEEFVAEYQAATITFESVSFNHPLYIMFSSGTTGVPKCIMHNTGGVLLQHIKELVLHTNVGPETRLFYFTTCGWMMWNYLVSGLACGATIMLYDGSPLYPGPGALFRYAEKYKINIFGTSAKYIEAVMKTKRVKKGRFDLSSLNTMLSTGSPLSPEGFRFVYQEIKEDICLASISGGTDIVSCFALGCPILPVYEGELQCVGLGMDVKALDDNGNECAVGEKGELSCLTPFPCMPIGFWNDANNEKYHEAYFSQFDNVWCHGDYIEITENGGMIIHGRSDAVLNPGGVRIGTAEIYRQVEKIDAVLESIVVGQQWDNDVRVVLFVKLADEETLSEQLIATIKATIRQNTTPRHVPAIILAVDDIPRTKSGKIVELAVKKVIHNEAIKNIEALANPEALAYFKDREELQ